MTLVTPLKCLIDEPPGSSWLQLPLILVNPSVGSHASIARRKYVHRASSQYNNNITSVAHRRIVNTIVFYNCQESWDVIKWKHFPGYWPFVRGIHRSSVNSPHKGQWREALMFFLIGAWINRWVNNGEAGDLRRYRAHYDVIVMVRS